MKYINTYIIEKLKINKSKLNTVPEYTLFPVSKGELTKMVKDEIDKNGNECSLNHIDVSKITNLSYLFYNSHFNGDISQWDVSNVQTMENMFCDSYFNGDISEWDVSSVRSMKRMFENSKFNGDISQWDVSSVWDMSGMFFGATNFNQDISMWKIKPRCERKNMFANCEIKNKFKPKVVKK